LTLIVNDTCVGVSTRVVMVPTTMALALLAIYSRFAAGRHEASVNPHAMITINLDHLVSIMSSGRGSGQLTLEECIHHPQDLGGIVGVVDAGAKLRAIAHAVREVGGELLHLAHRVHGAVLF